MQQVIDHYNAGTYRTNLSTSLLLVMDLREKNKVNGFYIFIEAIAKLLFLSLTLSFSSLFVSLPLSLALSL
jgi:hypothetical protein